MAVTTVLDAERQRLAQQDLTPEAVLRNVRERLEHVREALRETPGDAALGEAAKALREAERQARRQVTAGNGTRAQRKRRETGDKTTLDARMRANAKRDNEQVWSKRTAVTGTSYSSGCGSAEDALINAWQRWADATGGQSDTWAGFAESLAESDESAPLPVGTPHDAPALTRPWHGDNQQVEVRGFTLRDIPTAPAPKRDIGYAVGDERARELRRIGKDEVWETVVGDELRGWNEVLASEGLYVLNTAEEARRRQESRLESVAEGTAGYARRVTFRSAE